MTYRYQQALMRVISARPLLTRLVSILVVVIIGIATGWVAGFALHRLVHRDSPLQASPRPPSAGPAPVQSETSDSTLPDSSKPDVIIDIPGHDGAGRERHHYLSLGQIMRGIERIGHGKKKHHEGKDHDGRD